MTLKQSMLQNIEGWIKVNFILLAGYVALNMIMDYMGMAVLPYAFEATVTVFAVFLYGVLPLFFFRKIRSALSLISFHLSYKK